MEKQVKCLNCVHMVIPCGDAAMGECWKKSTAEEIHCLRRCHYFSLSPFWQMRQRQKQIKPTTGK